MRYFLLLLACLCAPAYASLDKVYEWKTGLIWSVGPGVGATAEQACADMLGKINAYQQSQPSPKTYTDGGVRNLTETAGSCSFLNNGSASGAIGTSVTRQREKVCPENSSANGDSCECNGGYSQSGQQCVEAENCGDKAGKSDIVNITSGWKRTPSVGDPSEQWVITNNLPSGGQFSVCSPSTPGGTTGCKQDIDAGEPCAECKGWVSQVPGNNGLYRVSTDFKGHYSGQSCAASDSEVSQDLLTPDDSKDPPCPGYVGQVNGVKGCWGNAQKPVPSTDPNKPNNNGSDKGNPPAGNKPDSGPGSGTDGPGRTPDTGTGGSAGGPSGAAGGSKPDGTTDKPEEGSEQEACGAPGQPPCKIDETGTPKEFKGDGGKGLDQWKAEVEKNRDQIKDSGESVFSGMQNLWAAPPMSACTPVELPTGATITRHCDITETGRAIMGYVWALGALWLCLGWIREAI